MSIPDSLVDNYAWLLLAKHRQDLPQHPRDAKAALARGLVARLHGEDAAGRAEEDFNVKFRKRDVPEDIPEMAIDSPDVVEALVQTGLARTRGDAKRLVEQSGVRVNGEKIGADARLKDGDVLQAGKRNFVRIRLK
jgi:tyrosyl-tRNA synthetase